MNVSLAVGATVAPAVASAPTVATAVSTAADRVRDRPSEREAKRTTPPARLPTLPTAATISGEAHTMPASTHSDPISASIASKSPGWSTLVDPPSRKSPTRNDVTPTGPIHGRWCRHRSATGERRQHRDAGGRASRDERGDHRCCARGDHDHHHVERHDRQRRHPVVEEPVAESGAMSEHQPGKCEEHPEQRAEQSGPEALQSHRATNEAFGCAVGRELTDRHELASGRRGERCGDHDADRHQRDDAGDPAPGELTVGASIVVVRPLRGVDSGDAGDARSRAPVDSICCPVTPAGRSTSVSTLA